MRKIEQKMLKAIAAGREWQSGNTRVNPVVGFIEVQLHGHTIARCGDAGGGKWEVKPDLHVFRQWPTATTCSRLRALGIAAHIKNGVPCIDGKPI